MSFIIAVIICRITSLGYQKYFNKINFALKWRLHILQNLLLILAAWAAFWVSVHFSAFQPLASAKSALFNHRCGCVWAFICYLSQAPFLLSSLCHWLPLTLQGSLGPRLLLLLCSIVWMLHGLLVIAFLLGNIDLIFFAFSFDITKASLFRADWWREGIKLSTWNEQHWEERWYITSESELQESGLLYV